MPSKGRKSEMQSKVRSWWQGIEWLKRFHFLAAAASWPPQVEPFQAQIWILLMERRCLFPAVLAQIGLKALLYKIGPQKHRQDI